MKVFKASYLINPLPTPLPRGPLRLSTQKTHSVHTNNTYKRPVHVNDFLSLTPISFRNQSSIVNI